MAVKREKISQTEKTKLRVLKYNSETSFMFFVMMLFKEHNGQKFIPYKHIQEIVAVLEAIVRGQLKRVVINIPP